MGLTFESARRFTVDTWSPWVFLLWLGRVGCQRARCATTSLGLVTAMRAANGYRQYSEDALERLRLISAAKELRPSLRSVLYWKWEAGS